MRYHQFTDRTIMIKINSYPTITMTIQVSISTTMHDNDNIQDVYDKIDEVLCMTKAEQNIITLGNWNAFIGEYNDGYIIGIMG